MVFGLLAWNWKGTITNTIPTSLLSPSLSHKDAADPNPTSTVPSEEGTMDNHKKTKPRFWSSKDHLLPSVWDYERPESIHKIMALVFFGRRQAVSILDCYLKRNLRKNGGLLDGVIFVKRTNDPKDLALLDRLIDSDPDYEKWHVEMGRSNQYSSGFGHSYERIEDDVLYVKIDDDIVFMEDSAIPSIVQKKVEHPEYYLVSANIVNQPLLSWVHWNLNAIHPYLPELNKTYPVPGTKIDWRASELPDWEESLSDDNFNLDDWEPKQNNRVHRWLPLQQARRDHILDRTPIENTEYHPYGRGWTQWKIGAQEHYSFLENLEKDELFHYKFGTWDFQYQRMGIQFVAMMGRDINIAKPIEADDEKHFSRTMTRQLGRHGVADGRGMAVHYSFGSQRGGMDTTDILERYRAYARENICEVDMLWSPELEEAENKEEKKKKEEEEAKKKKEEKGKKEKEG
ncbi:hypothetical protein BGZ63DRAFT_360853 [Mariannaea sp. PMI_226]|nr:hypothetical protein BGZ63DRAFT_360853 [Mariannaea sp. PMI_226]